MMNQPKILVFAGSAREGSFNKKLARVMTAALVKAGAAATFIDLRDFPMPLFDEDLETAQGEPAAATAFKRLMMEHDAFVVVSPENNSTYSALLKNTIDWASRKREGETPLQCFSGKTAMILSASPGQLGGLRGLAALRMLLGNLGVILLPDQLALSAANKAFNPDGSLAEEDKAKRVQELAGKLVAIASKMKG